MSTRERRLAQKREQDARRFVKVGAAHAPPPDVRSGHPAPHSLGCRRRFGLQPALVGIRRLSGRGRPLTSRIDKSSLGFALQRQARRAVSAPAGGGRPRSSCSKCCRKTASHGCDAHHRRAQARPGKVGRMPSLAVQTERRQDAERSREAACARHHTPALGPGPAPHLPFLCGDQFSTCRIRAADRIARFAPMSRGCGQTTRCGSGAPDARPAAGIPRPATSWWRPVPRAAGPGA